MANDGTTPGLSVTQLKTSHSGPEFRVKISQLLRSAPISEWGSASFLLLFLLTTEFDNAMDETDLVMWDRVCRTLSSNQATFRLDVISKWAVLLSHWSLNSRNPVFGALRFQAALHRYEQILRDEEASVVQRAMALFNRGLTYGKRGEEAREIADYTTLIQTHDAPADQKAMALSNRGITYGQRGEVERAIADFTALIGMPNAPVDQKAKALINRGVAYGKRGEAEKAIADFTALIGMPNAPADQKAQALIGRGWTHFSPVASARRLQTTRARSRSILTIPGLTEIWR